MRRIETCCHSALSQPRLDRRGMLGLLGGTAVMLGTGLRPGLALAAGGTDALLLNCIDYRLTGHTERYMSGRGMAGKYAPLWLAALGAKNEKFPAWGTTFMDHVQVAIDLHNIHKVVIMDHRDCGAYKVILGKDLAADPKEELAVHAKQMQALKADIGKKHPKLEVELLLMGLDGKVETVS